MGRQRSRVEGGILSVRTDKQTKSGQWYVSNRKLIRTLADRGFLNEWASNYDIEIDGEDDGVLVISDFDGNQILQLEYERHHDIEEKPKGLFGEPGAAMSKSNPLSSLSTGEKVGIAAAGVAVVGLVGYFIWKSQQTAPTAAAPGTSPVPPS